ncbi:MAG: hypothetical protein Q4F29_14475 [Lachnospiraceae bacterium]|nr:hypothetical protein [Lachnospiraceae bacterium]
MRRVRDNKYGYSAWSDAELKRFGVIGALVVLLVVLAAAFFIVNKKNADGQQADGAKTESLMADGSQPGSQNPDPGEGNPAAGQTADSSATKEGEGNPTADDGASEGENASSQASDGESQSAETEAVSEGHDFAVNEVPEIVDLMSRYFTAKQNADVETIYSLFGWSDQTGADSLKRQLQYDARYTDGYRNIVCYTKPGVSEGSYLVYVSYDLKFKNSLTLAPGLLWNYVKQGEDGAWHLTDVETLDEVELAFVSEAEKAEEIGLLKTQIYAKLRQALEDDAQLAEGYGILEKQGGAAGAKQAETKHEADVQIGND